ncbi:hypothetical protein Tco_0522313 [Tanacetum coccineum]
MRVLGKDLWSKVTSGSGAHEGTGVTPGVPNVPTYESDDEQISWKSSEEEDDDDENVSEQEDDDDDERTESDNDGDDFIHPKFSTHDDEAKQDEEVNEEDSFDPRMNEEETYAEDEANVLYGDVNINLEGKCAVMIDATLPDSSSISSGFVSNMLNPRPDTGIDSIFYLNTKTTLLVDVLVTTIAEPPIVFATTLPPPPAPLITLVQNTSSTPTIIPMLSLQIFPNFGSFLVSSIHGIVDAYLANKINEAVKTVVQLKSDKLKNEAQAKNKAFLNSLDENIKKIIKDQVKQQVKAQVLALKLEFLIHEVRSFSVLVSGISISYRCIRMYWKTGSLRILIMYWCLGCNSYAIPVAGIAFCSLRFAKTDCVLSQGFVLSHCVLPEAAFFNTSSTDSQMHNNIMTAGSKDRPPMLGPGRYSQWRSRFLWYIDTKPNGKRLRKSILSGPYVPSTVLVQAIAVTEGNPTIQQHTTIETVLNMTPENKEHFLSEKEAIFLLLTSIGDDIYSTVDACKTAPQLG